jgi:lipopolysaccharide transport system ATP-binding protein
VADTMDIRESICMEVEYDVLVPGQVIVPHADFVNEEGTTAFVTIDLDPAWHRRPRPVGTFISTVRIPANFLAEGSLVAGIALSTMDPFIVHVHVPDAVAFHVTDALDGDSARGDYGGQMPGVVRPLLAWSDRLVGVPVEAGLTVEARTP